METNKQDEIIDLRKIVIKIWKRKKLFLKVLPIVFIVSCVYIVVIPRYYRCSVMLAPEVENPVSGGNLSSLASSFGINLNSATSTDAISPTLYPDLMASTDFIVSLFPVMVTTEDSDLTVNYCDYIMKHQKMSIWEIPFSWVKNLFAEKSAPFSGTDKINPFRLSKKQSDVVKKISKKIDCSIDKKTDVITITVEDQDKLICAAMADTVSVLLQKFITEYRTNKARNDMEYYEKLTRQAKLDYDSVLQVYGRYMDANMNLILESYKLKQTELENDLQLKFNTYTALNTQYQTAKAKVQERTPAFTTLQCATVPIKAAGPKRMIFVIAMMFLGCVGVVIYILKDDFINQLKK